MNKKIKIFVSYHKKSPIIKSDVFVPIEVGRALKNPENNLKDIMIGDNEGENISEKNPDIVSLRHSIMFGKTMKNLEILIMSVFVIIEGFSTLILTDDFMDRFWVAMYFNNL